MTTKELAEYKFEYVKTGASLSKEYNEFCLKAGDEEIKELQLKSEEVQENVSNYLVR